MSAMKLLPASVYFDRDADVLQLLPDQREHRGAEPGGRRHGEGEAVGVAGFGEQLLGLRRGRRRSRVELPS